MTDEIKAAARRLGFDPVGVTSVDPPQHWAFYQQWLNSGYAGEMGYLARNQERRFDPREIVPDAKCVLCVGLNYLPGEQTPESDGRITKGDKLLLEGVGAGFSWGGLLVEY